MRVDVKSKWAALVCGAIGLLSVLASLTAHAFEVVKLDELTLEYRNYALVNSNNHPLLIYPESAKEAINLGVNIDFMKYAYIDPLLETMTTDSQYRGVGLQLNIGVRITPGLSVGYWHHSQHVLDRVADGDRHFPVEDAVVVRWTIFHARPGRPAIIE